MKTLDELKALWNAKADCLTQWDDLGLDERVEFAQSVEREACAKVCLDEARLWEIDGNGPATEARLCAARILAR